MLFEGLLFLILCIVCAILIGLPIYRFVNSLNLRRSNPLKEAKVRLEIAKAEVEAAKLNKEAEELYSELYEDVLKKEKHD